MPRKPKATERAEIERALWEQWRTARARAGEWTERAAKLRARLEAQIGASTTATVNGIPVISWKETDKINSFDAKAHKEAEPQCHERFMIKKPGTRPFNELDFDEELLDGED
jgi:hypothetical protein